MQLAYDHIITVIAINSLTLAVFEKPHVLLILESSISILACGQYPTAHS